MGLSVVERVHNLLSEVYADRDIEDCSERVQMCFRDLQSILDHESGDYMSDQDLWEDVMEDAMDLINKGE